MGESDNIQTYIYLYFDLWDLGLLKDNLHIKCSLRAEQEEQASA